MRVAAIMPCRGRPEQTVRNVRRLLATAGTAADVDWRLTCIGATTERELLTTLSRMGVHTRCLLNTERLTYWQAMQYETDFYATDGADAPPLIANLANDLLPGQHWLARAVAAYRETFGDGPGLMGFNDGHHETEHSCHFLISRDLLARYGGWPIWYDHAYGDTELCQRAIADGCYAKAPWATLFHDHPYFGGDDDAVYAEGRRQVDRDYTLYEHRRRAGWPTPTSP